jgi:hypothetical protein
VGWDINVDLTALRVVLHVKPTIVLWGSVLIASMHKGIPQQWIEVVTMQTPHTQEPVLEGVVGVVSHLGQKLGKVRIFKEE